MEFRYRSGEQRGSLSSSSSFSSSSSSYFAEQALRAGIVPSTMSRTEALIEELRMERIREEIIVREIANKRMLEEEILRELELERRFEKRSFDNERFMPLEMESMARETSEHSFRDKYLEIREKGRSPCYRDIKMGGIEKSVGAFEKPIASRRAMVEKLGINKVLLKNETSGSMDNKLLDQKVSSIKRKAAIELPRLAQMEWSCSLCHVTATSQKNLEVHLQGKKHKVKEEQLTKKATSNNSNTSSSSFKKDSSVPLDQAKGTEGKKQDYKKRPSTFWCNLCKLKCNSLAMLDCHFNGRKHKAQMESTKGDGAGNTTMSTAEVVKEVIDQKEKKMEIKAEEDDAKVNGEEASNKTLVSSWERYFRSEKLGQSTCHNYPAFQ